MGPGTSKRAWVQPGQGSLESGETLKARREEMGEGKRKLPGAGWFPQSRKNSPVNSFLGTI